MAPFAIFIDPDTPPRPSPLRRSQTMPSPPKPTNLFGSIIASRGVAIKENLDPITGKPIPAPVLKGKKTKLAGSAAPLRIKSASTATKKQNSSTKKAPLKRALSSHTISPLTSNMPSLPSELFSTTWAVYTLAEEKMEQDDETQTHMRRTTWEWEANAVARRARDLTVSPLADVSEAYGAHGRADVETVPAQFDPASIPLPASSPTSMFADDDDASLPPAKRARLSLSRSNSDLL